MAAVQRIERRQEPGDAHDGHKHDVAIDGGKAAQCVRTGEDLHAWRETALQVGASTLVDQGDSPRPVLTRLLRKRVGVTPGTKRDNLELPGQGVDDLEGLPADAARRPEKDEPLHGIASSRSRM